MVCFVGGISFRGNHNVGIGNTNRIDGTHYAVWFDSAAAHRKGSAQRVAQRCVLKMQAQEVSNGRKTDTLVIGSGISGSSLAFSLHQAGADVILAESRDRVGGNVISRNENGYTWEEGPNTFQPAPHILRLAVDLGLKDDVVLADHTLPRFVYWNSELYALPLGPSDIPKFRLLSLWGAIRAGLGAAGLVLPPATKSGEEETVKDFITRHLGREVFEKMIDPFVSGVYAGDPSRLSMGSAFKKIKALEDLGNTRGIVEGAIIRLRQRKREAPPPDPELPEYKGGALGSFRRGLGMLPNAVKDRLGTDRVLLSHAVDSIEYSKEEEFPYTVTLVHAGSPVTVKAKHVALTTPARATASILRGLVSDSVLDRVAEVYYPEVVSVTLAYPNEAFKTPLKGFGNLIPRTMKVRTLGTIWSSVLFPGRCPENETLLLSYIGGARDVAIKDISDDEVANQVHADISKILLKDGAMEQYPPKVIGVRRWERAIPQYNVGHEGVIKDLLQGCEQYPGLHIGGNYRSGVAFGDCVLWGVETAKEIVSGN
eukprot:CAMPEP_0185843612 /NCGR_PEP_ID=MMETSP1354-20130828/38_1 /TAXON_ID=708628 /ORGANISM="Erythrolobus madagascarensis, Strain CCMP3276" /LENGTH=539 /DNA_ID=CAMNT_0028543131 /DNA_START=38 /DNA_END=1657 /DNA_ORIENTATION=-